MKVGDVVVRNDMIPTHHWFVIEIDSLLGHAYVRSVRGTIKKEKGYSRIPLNLLVVI
jgi:hypothetical protein